MNKEEIKTSRKLASIQVVNGIEAHPNSENHMIVSVLGWKVVIDKDNKELAELKQGDKVIYFEIDSLLPRNKSWAEVAKPTHYKLDASLIKNQISQGLVLPLSILSEHDKSTDASDYNEGDDLTSTLNIVKYENDADEKLPDDEERDPNAFPSYFGFDPTEEPRIQSEPGQLALFHGKPFYASLKYDGTSSTFFMDYNNDKEFYICSRNQRRPINKSDVYTRTATKYKIKEILEKNKGRYAIQGESYGPKIQNNPLKVKDLTFVVFSVYDYNNKKYLDLEEAQKFCKENKLDFVEVVLEGESFDYDIEKLKEVCKGFYKGTDNHREGLVFRLKKDFYTDKARASFKIINDDYLLNKNKKK